MHKDKSSHVQACALRLGTPVRAFDAQFPDDDACMLHVLRTRFGDPPRCPRCGVGARFYRRTRRSFGIICCGLNQISPFAGTAFSNTSLSPRLLFQVMLYVANSSGSVTSTFVARHFGLSPKAAWRTLLRVRQHFQAIDEDVLLGSARQPIYLMATTVAHIRPSREWRQKQARVVVASDGEHFRTVIQREPKVRTLLNQIESIAHPAAALVTREYDLRQQLLDHRERCTLKAARVICAPDPFATIFSEMHMYAVRLKHYLLASHRTISAKFLPDYAGAYDFIARCERESVSPFGAGISAFPRIATSAAK